MASKAVVSMLLLCMLVLAATSMADYGGAAVYSPGEQCRSGWGYPVYALPRCRALMKHQCLGHQAPEAVRRECCQQLAAVPDSWCRCEALGSMLSSMYRELGVAKGRVEAFPGCRREDLKLAAASVPAFCNVYIPNGEHGVCYWVSYPDNY